jgi:hypothetical protein
MDKHHSINQSIMASYYTVNAYVDEEFVFTSDMFNTEEEAHNLFNLLNETNPNGGMTFKVFAHSEITPVYSTSGLTQTKMTSFLTTEPNYKSMTIFYHDDMVHYVLEPPMNSSHYGQEELLGGYWDENYQGWILTKKQAREAKKLGATVSRLDTSEPQECFVDYPSMTLYLHSERKDTYLLEPPEDSSLRGLKGFLGGRWSKSNGGWILSSAQADDAIARGATVYRSCHEDETDEEEDEVYTYDGFTVEYYKNGLLMKPTRLHPLIGEKYLGKGFWNRTLKGWVFKTDQLDFLVANGAKVIKKEPTTTQKKNTFSTMTYHRYGKGFLLKPKRDHPDFGEKYYHDGFWMPKQNAWFFRGRFEDFVTTCGAKQGGDM